MRKTRSLAPIILASSALLGWAGCTEPTAPTELGRLIARESLTVADGNQVPCCTVTSSGGYATIVAGALNFYASAHYVDTVATPGGWMSAACVQEVPSGALVHLNGLVTLPDGTSYLMLPCSVGTYRLTLTEQIAYPDGSSQTNDILLTSGSFKWHRDALALREFEGGHVTTSLSGATVTVTLPGHRYLFVATTIR